MENSEQTEWVEELKSRIIIDNQSDVCISILDTGINNGHNLINPVLKDEDCFSHDDLWGIHDHEGHGTGMAGLAIYGDLQKAIESDQRIHINHCLESSNYSIRTSTF